jgi:cytochrome c-type biogenesis protein
VVVDAELTPAEKRLRVYLVILATILFSIFLVGVFYVSTASLTRSVGLTLSYASGMTMILLPCTLPMVFVIVPLTMGQSYKKGLTMAALYGVGVSTTLALYGIGIAFVGRYLGDDIASQSMWLIAGVAAYTFGLSSLGIINVKIPAYSGPLPNFMKYGDYLKSFSFGLLVGNAGIGCPCPHWYVILLGIAALGDPVYGAYTGFVHGLGRMTPVVAIAILGILGVNATGSLVKRKDQVDKIMGWALIFFGAFFIVFMALAHSWYQNSVIHVTWNNFLLAVGGKGLAETFPPFPRQPHQEILKPLTPYAPYIFLALILIPVVKNLIKKSPAKEE